jgi:hypothetical protein
MLGGTHSYTYHPSEVSHTVAKKGDTDSWTTALSALVHSDRAGVELKPRDLLRLDNVILEVELKKASVGSDEINVRSSLSSVAQNSTAPHRDWTDERVHFHPLNSLHSLLRRINNLVALSLSFYGHGSF